MKSHTKKCIIFAHHKSDEFTKWSIARVKKFNPDWDVVPIGFEKFDTLKGLKYHSERYKLLPDSLLASKIRYPSNKILSFFSNKKSAVISREDWLNTDLLLYEAFRLLPEYDEYFFYEYDTVCNTSIEYFFNTDLDFFCNNGNNSSSEDWEWSKRYRRINRMNKLVPKLYHTGQFTCIYFKRSVLSKCCEDVIKNSFLYDNMLSEMRLGTIVKKFTDLKLGRPDLKNYISWKPFPMDFSSSYFYHPVKNYEKILAADAKSLLH